MNARTSHWAGLATGILLSGVAIQAGCPEFFTRKHLEALTGDPVSTRAFWRGQVRDLDAGGLPFRGVPELPAGP